MKINFKKLNSNAKTPFHAKYGDAGSDLFASESLNIPPHSQIAVPTGIATEIPYGYVGYINPRSSMAIKGIGILNAPGTIDSGYRGEIKVILYNTTDENYVINVGDKIAQIVIHRFETIDFEQVDELSITDRGAGGFGSTGS